jgi:hypothetical protein
MRDWRQARRQNSLGRLVRRAPHQSLDRRFRALLEAGLREFGGIEQLATDLVQEIKRAQAADQGDRFALNGMLLLLRLMEHCDSRKAASQVNEDDFSSLTDEELRERICQDTIALIQAQPEIAVGPLRMAGWQVIPPTSYTP